MKILSILLGAYISFLSVQPVMVAVEPSDGVQEQANCLFSSDQQTICCAEEKNSEQAASTCFPEDPSCTNTCCFCGLYCFCCIVGSPDKFIHPGSGIAKWNNTSDVRLVSNYHSDCFRPPEYV